MDCWHDGEYRIVIDMANNKVRKRKMSVNYLGQILKIERHNTGMWKKCAKYEHYSIIRVCVLPKATLTKYLCYATAVIDIDVADGLFC